MMVPEGEVMPGSEIEGLAVIDAGGVDDLLHLLHVRGLGGPALVRAIVAIGVVFAAVADDPDLEFPGAPDPHPAFGDIAVLANQRLGHQRSLQSSYGTISYGTL